MTLAPPPRIGEDRPGVRVHRLSRTPLSAGWGQVLPAPQKGSQGEAEGPCGAPGWGRGRASVTAPNRQPHPSPRGSVCLSVCLMRDMQMPPEWDLHLTEPPGQTRVECLNRLPSASAFPPEPSLGEEQSRWRHVRPAPCIRNRPRAPRLGSPCGRRAPPA